jgi:hypothetical protein
MPNPNTMRILKELTMWMILRSMTMIIKMKIPLRDMADRNHGLRSTIRRTGMRIRVSNMADTGKNTTHTVTWSPKITRVGMMMICGNCWHSCPLPSCLYAYTMELLALFIPGRIEVP